jgi:hypothetical protein
MRGGAMRISKTVDGLTVQATAGTYVVLLGMDLDAAKVDQLLGFSIERTDHAGGETYWMWNDILFPANDALAKADRDAGNKPNPALFESGTNPFQEFLRGDYTVQISFHPQPSVLFAQLGQLGFLRRGEAGSLTSIDAGLTHPVPQRALTDTETAGNVDDQAALVDHQPHSITLELIGERAPRPHRLLFHH